MLYTNHFTKLTERCLYYDLIYRIVLWFLVGALTAYVSAFRTVDADSIKRLIALLNGIGPGLNRYGVLSLLSSVGFVLMVRQIEWFSLARGTQQRALHNAVTVGDWVLGFWLKISSDMAGVALALAATAMGLFVLTPIYLESSSKDIAVYIYLLVCFVLAIVILSAAYGVTKVTHEHLLLQWQKKGKWYWLMAYPALAAVIGLGAWFG